jgi:hypothetical protein
MYAASSSRKVWKFGSRPDPNVACALGAARGAVGTLGTALGEATGVVDEDDVAPRVCPLPLKADVEAEDGACRLNALSMPLRPG